MSRNNEDKLSLVVSGRLSPKTVSTCVKVFQDTHGFPPHRLFDAIRNLLESAVHALDLNMTPQDIVKILDIYKNLPSVKVKIPEGALKEALKPTREDHPVRVLDQINPPLAEMFRFVEMKRPDLQTDEAIYQVSYNMLRGMNPTETLQDYIKRKKGEK